jgi:hypothetical protein
MSFRPSTTEVKKTRVTVLYKPEYTAGREAAKEVHYRTQSVIDAKAEYERLNQEKQRNAITRPAVNKNYPTQSVIGAKAEYERLNKETERSAVIRPSVAENYRTHPKLPCARGSVIGAKAEYERLHQETERSAVIRPSVAEHYRTHPKLPCARGSVIGAKTEYERLRQDTAVPSRRSAIEENCLPRSVVAAKVGQEDMRQNNAVLNAKTRSNSIQKTQLHPSKNKNTEYFAVDSVVSYRTSAGKDAAWVDAMILEIQTDTLDDDGNPYLCIRIEGDAQKPDREIHTTANRVRPWGTV